MPQIRMRERNQLTLPASIANAANIAPNDALDVTYVNGVITIVRAEPTTKKRSIHDFVGIGNGMWGKSAKEIDTHIRAERDSWERK